MSKTLLELVREKRDEAIKPANDLIALAETEQRNLTADEFTTVQTISASDDVKALDERIAVLADIAQRSATATIDLPKGSTIVKVRSEPLTYQRGDVRTSYFKDLGMSHVGGDQEARMRLQRHRSEMNIEIPAWEARKEAAFERSLDEFRQEGDVGVQKRDISRVDGAGGEFVPPLWLIQEYAEFVRATRVSAGLIRNIPLPMGTDSINIPRITTGTATAIQTADNAAVSEVDMVTNSVAGPVRTIAGQQDIALQLLEQSPIVFDDVVFSDLIADYNSKLDTQILNGSGAAGQHTGFLTLAGTNSTTYVDASPTFPELWPIGAQALSQASTGRKLTMSGFIMHSRRWFWMTSTLDTANRPFVVPAPAGPYNALATMNGVAAEGPVGTWHGYPVFLDQNMPLTLGAGTEDAIITYRGADHLLFEGAMRTRALPEVLSGTLTVRLQVYAYSALILGRFPAGVSKITGTGLIAPAGF